MGARLKRWRLWLIGFLGVAVMVAGAFSYLAFIFYGDLTKAIAEADQLDPGWRIMELENKRRMVADEENSALVLGPVKKLIPLRWPFWWYPNPQGAETKDFSAEELRVLRDWHDFSEPEPPFQLNGLQAKALRSELDRAAEALREVRKVADMPRGRCPIQYSRDGISTRLNFTQAARLMATLLHLDVLLRCQEVDVQGALRSCRGIFYVGHSVGDEPTLISTLVRMAIHPIAVRKMEHILGQGQVSDADLAAFQRLIEEEIKEPLFLIGARGERALMDCFMEAIAHGDVRPWQVPPGSVEANSPVNELYSIGNLRLLLVPGAAKATRAALLRYHNRFVEIAKRPFEEQKTLMDELAASAKTLPPLGQELAKGTVKVAWAARRDQAMLRCALVMLAVERDRIARGRWPDKLDDLVGVYLKKVPLDPNTGNPIGYRKDRDHVAVYTVGKDGTDHGGNVGKEYWKDGFDLGFRLWDADNRRQPPGP